MFQAQSRSKERPIAKKKQKTLQSAANKWNIIRWSLVSLQTWRQGLQELLHVQMKMCACACADVPKSWPDQAQTKVHEQPLKAEWTGALHRSGQVKCVHKSKQSAQRDYFPARAKKTSSSAQAYLKLPRLHNPLIQFTVVTGNSFLHVFRRIRDLTSWFCSGQHITGHHGTPCYSKEAIIHKHMMP